jgi:hypothetical protein
MTTDTKLLERQGASDQHSAMRRSEPSVDTGSPRKFLRRKTKAGAPSIAADAAADKDPAAQASLIATAWRGGVDAVINAGVLMMESLRAFGDDPERLDAFMNGLVAVHVLTPKEARLRLVSPKLVKLRTIGEHEDFLRRKEIASYLGPSYSTIYQLIVVFRTLPEGDDEQRVKRLVGILEGCPDEITREYLSDETNRLKQTRKADKAKQAAVNQTAAESAAGETIRDLAQTQQQFKLVLLTPRERDLKRLSDNYADGDTLKRCLPLVQALQQSDSVSVIIVARVFDLPVIVDRLLPLCGFARPSRVLLARQPKSPDVTDAEIVIIAERGKVRLDLPRDGVWLDEEGTINASAIAARLYPDAARKLHVFAAARTEGWTSMIGDDSWAEEPSLR